VCNINYEQNQSDQSATARKCRKVLSLFLTKEVAQLDKLDNCTGSIQSCFKHYINEGGVNNIKHKIIVPKVELSTVEDANTQSED
jgi:hypothetical protein